MSLLRAILWQCFAIAVVGASCDTQLNSTFPPTVADGWSFEVLAQNITSPRGLVFDNDGNLLVVARGTGIIQYQLDYNGGDCVTVAKETVLVNSSELNHGIAVSQDGNTLYASSSNIVFSWDYDAGSASVSDSNTTLVTGMANDDHTTRTLLLASDGSSLLVSRGSNSNIDNEAEDLGSGHSQIRVFNITDSPSMPYNFDTDGRLLGWGLRNSVGVAQHPLTGGIFSVENSVDQITRDGRDIHEDNPGEELNFHGFLNASTIYQGANYGYPHCFAAWDTDIPHADGLEVGDQFVMSPNATLNDTTCADDFVAPVLTFQAHMAPLDIKFTPEGTTAYVSFHGSWDRDDPVGYKVSQLSFAGGWPTAPSNSTDSLVEVLTNQNLSACPDSCFRPVGLALDGSGRLFVTSDATGEIFVLATANSTAAPSNAAGHLTLDYSLAALLGAATLLLAL